MKLGSFAPAGDSRWCALLAACSRQDLQIAGVSFADRAGQTVGLFCASFYRAPGQSNRFSKLHLHDFPVTFVRRSGPPRVPRWDQSDLIVASRLGPCGTSNLRPMGALHPFIPPPPRTAPHPYPGLDLSNCARFVWPVGPATSLLVGCSCHCHVALYLSRDPALLLNSNCRLLNTVSVSSPPQAAFTPPRVCVHSYPSAFRTSRTTFTRDPEITVCGLTHLR